LWGPRKVGKSTLLRTLYPHAHWVDLLETDTWARLIKEPWLLRRDIEGMAKKPELVIIDEVQRVPQLLDEVHLMIERMGMAFALSGSSARKVRRGKANLLGGRALRYELYGLTIREIAGAYDLTHILNTGSIPEHVMAERPEATLDSYVNNYLREEILEEGLVRSLQPFSKALVACALSDASPISYTPIARDCGVSSQTVRDYVQIMEDTLIASLVPAYTRRPKRRVRHTPKIFFFDVGVVNALAKRRRIEPESQAYGQALENWIHHELRAHRMYSGLFHDLTYYRTTGGVEVDFILGDMDAAIEVKATDHARDHHLKSLRMIAEDYTVKQRILVCLESHAMETDDGIRILPVEEFLRELWEGKILQ